MLVQGEDVPEALTAIGTAVGSLPDAIVITDCGR